MLKQAKCPLAVLVASVLVSVAVGAPLKQQTSLPDGSASRQYTAALNADDYAQPGQKDIVQDIPSYADEHLADRYRRSRAEPKGSQSRSRAKTVQQKTAQRPIATWSQGASLRIFSQMVKPPGASLSQTMASIYLANPEAFYSADPNRLKPGVKLTVPPAATIRALPEAQAESLIGLNAPPLNANRRDGEPTTRLPDPPTKVAASAPDALKIDSLEKRLLERDAALESAKTRVQMLESRMASLQQQNAAATSSSESLVVMALLAAGIGIIGLLVLLFALMSKRNAKPKHDAIPPAYEPVSSSSDEDAAIGNITEEEMEYHINNAVALHSAPDAALALNDTPADITFPIATIDAPQEKDSAASVSLKPSPLGKEAVFDLDLDAVVAAKPQLPEDSLSAKGSDFLLDFDFALEPVAKMADLPAVTATSGAVTPVHEVNDMELDFTPEMAPYHENEPLTAKLDLARVYLDMGDRQGAREVLQDLLVTEAPRDLRAQAERMLAQLT